MKMYLCFYVNTSMQLDLFGGEGMFEYSCNRLFYFIESIYVTQSKSFLSFFLSFSNTLE